MERHITTNHAVKQVGGYVRVSTFEQAERGTSVYEQKRLIREECRRRAWRLIGIYCDEGASGKLINRRGLYKLQQDAYAGLFSVIMFTKSDRLTRSLRDLSNLWHDWTEAGLEIICISQPEINSEGMSGKIIRNLLGTFAEWERDTIIERTSSGRMARWRNTEAIIGSLPYGYNLNRESRKITLCPVKNIICKRIFKLYLDRKLSARDIAIYLTNESIPTPRGQNRRWQYGTILRILKNPAYTGKADYNMYKFITLTSKDGRHYASRIKEKKDTNKWVTIKFPALISKTRYKQIQELMMSRSLRFIKKDASYGKSFLLENVAIYCGMCGGKMHFKYSTKNGMRKYYKYYRCRFNSMAQKELESYSGERPRCKMSVDAFTLDNYVFARVMAFFDNILTITRNGLSNLRLEDITERVNAFGSASPQEAISSKMPHVDCRPLIDWMVSEISASEYKDILASCRKYSRRIDDTNKLQKTLEAVDNLIKSDINILRICNKGVIGSEGTTFSLNTSNYIDSMPFNHRKKVIESLIGPEKGGKCIIKWNNVPGSLDEIIPQQENTTSFNNSRYNKSPVTVEIKFYMSLGAIQKLIWGVGGASLFDAIRGRRQA